MKSPAQSMYTYMRPLFIVLGWLALQNWLCLLLCKYTYKDKVRTTNTKPSSCALTLRSVSLKVTFSTLGVYISKIWEVLSFISNDDSLGNSSQDPLKTWAGQL